MPSTTATRTINKVVSPGKVDVGYPSRRLVDVFCRIQYDDAKLRITGVEGPFSSGNAAGSCGQIALGYAHRDSSQDDSRYDEPTRITAFADGWTENLWFDFLDVWKVWHLNDTQSACEHQRAAGISYNADPDNVCEVCGYKIGTAWLTMDVPAEVLDFLEGLPESSKTPAWV